MPRPIKAWFGDQNLNEIGFAHLPFAVDRDNARLNDVAPRQLHCWLAFATEFHEVPVPSQLQVTVWCFDCNLTTDQRAIVDLVFLDHFIQWQIITGKDQHWQHINRCSEQSFRDRTVPTHGRWCVHDRRD